MEKGGKGGVEKGGKGGKGAWTLREPFMLLLSSAAGG